MILVLLATIWLMMVSSPGAYAQANRETIDQTRADRSQPDLTPHDFNPKSTFWKQLFENMHGSYSVTLMGPRFLGASNETYNLYIPDVAPIQLYHSSSIYFQVNPDLTVGFGVDAVQNIANDVQGETGFVRGRNFIFYDPTINFTFPNLVKVPGWWVSHSASFSLAVTDASINIGRVTALNFWSTWRVNNYPSPWNVGFDLNLNPEFYTQPYPPNTPFRKTLYASIGSFVGYQISPTVSINNTTIFDVNHREGIDEGFFSLGTGLADRSRFNLVITPNVYPAFMSFTGYVQVLVWDMRPETTITGLAWSISF